MTDGSPKVWILDTSGLVDFKKLIRVDDQWAAFKQFEQLANDGGLAMPRHVITETSEIDHPDMPGAWAAGMRRQLQHPLDPAVDPWLLKVMAETAAVVDQSKETEEADPYVVALALQLADAGCCVAVVTSDVVDRMPIKIALATACAHFAIDVVSPRDFLIEQGIRVRKLAADEESDDDD